MARLVVLEDSVIRQMLLRPDIVAAFPFMSAAAAKVSAVKKQKGCNCANKNRSNLADYSGIRGAIANMSNDSKLKLKQLLNAEELRLNYTNAKRQVVKMTF